MTMFLLQSLLWLLVAFLLGYGIGRFLKGLFCKRSVTLESNAPHAQDGATRLHVPATSAAVVAGTAAAAAAAVAARNRGQADVKVKAPDIKAPDVKVKMPDVKAPDIRAKMPEVKAPDVRLPKVDVKAPDVRLPKVDVKAPDVTLPKVDVKVPDVTLPKVDVKAPDVRLPKVDVKLSEINVPDVSLPKVDVKLPDVDMKSVVGGVVGLGAAAIGAVAAKLPEVSAPEVKLPDVDVSLPKVNLPEVAVNVPEVSLPDVDVSLPKIDLPEVAVNVPEISLPDVDVSLPKVDLPEVAINVPEISLPDVDVSLPKIDLPEVAVNVPEISLPDVDVSLPKVDLPEVAINVPEISLPDVDVSLPKVDLPEVAVNVPEISLPDVDVSLPKIDLPEVAVNVPEISLPDVDVSLPKIGLPEVAVNVPEISLPDVDLKSVAGTVLGVGAATLGVVGTTLKAPDGDVDLTLAELQTPDADVGLKSLDMRMPTTGADLTAAEWHEGDAHIDVAALNVPGVQVDLPEGRLPAMDVGLAAANVRAGSGDLDLTALRVDVPDVDIGLPDADGNIAHGNVGLGVAELKTSEGHFGLEGISVRADGSSEAMTAVRLTKPDGGVELAAFATDAAGQSSLAAIAAQMQDGKLDLQALNLNGMDASSVLEVVKAAALAAGAGGVVAAASGLAQSADADVGEAVAGIDEDVSLVWDADAVDARAGALTLRPGETGNLGLLSCAVPEVGTVSLGGLCGGLAAGQTGLSKLYGVAVSRDGDDNYTFTRVAAPDMALGASAAEEVNLAWDDVELDSAALAGLDDTLTLQAGQRGKLGLVSCAVPAAGEISLGGVAGNLEPGQAVLSKLYGIAVSRDDANAYTFVRLPDTAGASWLTAAKTAVVAAGAGVAASVASAANSAESVESAGVAGATTVNAAAGAETDPLRLAVQHLVAEAKASPTQTVSRLWDADAGYDCSLLAGSGVVKLQPGMYDNLGSVHCGVTKQGVVAVSGDVSPVAEGEAVLFHLYDIVVCRDSDTGYSFVHLPQGGAGQAVPQLAQGVDSAADGSVGVDVGDDADWHVSQQRIAMQRALDESGSWRGARPVTRLWDADAGYDCSWLDHDGSLNLQPGSYAKLGSVHCGVTKPGFVAVGGDVSPVAEGEAVLFHFYRILVSRDDQDNHRFLRLADLG